jgi:hypothetical protein
MAMTASSDSLIVVVSSTSTGNGLGRAMCLYWIAVSLSPAMLIAFDDGPVWSGVGEAGIVRASNQAAFRRAIFRALGERRRLVLWHSKPIGRTLSWSLRLAEEGSAHVVVDVDDDDAGFGDIFRSERLRNRLQLNGARSLSPPRIRRRLASLRRDRAFTASSGALARHLDLPAHTVVVPHARPAHPRLASPRDLAVPRFGFFGTPRTFKGMAQLRAFADAVGERAELHLFREPVATRQFAGLANVVWHRPVALAELRSVYEHVDVLLLPQQHEPAAQFQLPAKLCDALQFRRIVLATATPPIRETAADAFEAVEDWSDPQAVWDALGRAVERHGDHSERVDRAFGAISLERVATRSAGVLLPWRG